MDYERYSRWVLASHAVCELEPFMVVALQGLGRLDSQLTAKEREMAAARKLGHDGPTIQGSVDLTELVTLSYLWVLGAYEVVRSLNQRFKDLSDLKLRWHLESLQLKRSFERVRVPLAKFEAAKRYKTTDSHVAFPALTEEHGIAWRVSADQFTVRGHLSDLLLTFLEDLKYAQSA